MSAEPDEQSGRRRSASLRFLERYLEQVQPSRLTALLLGQLDAFNRITTTFGHERCEAFCAEYIERLRQAMPPRTPVVRLGDRRFAVLLPLDSMSAVMDAAVQLTEERPAYLTVDEEQFLVDVTLGVAVYPTHAEDAASLMRRAELALTDARKGELPFEIYRPDATKQQHALWRFETELDDAVQNGELDVYYQPKVSLDTGRTCGVEALVRWRTKTGCFMAANDFVPLAERNGAIVPITWLVFARVLEAASQWTAPEGFYVAVNVSPQVLDHSEFMSRLKDLHARLQAHGVALTVELTEDSLVQGETASLDRLDRIRRLGIGLAIDDFGRGYSSLGYLKQLPATEIKIDKRFVENVAVDSKDRDIVRAIVTLAQAFGMGVVAEGVDSAEALAIVAELGCQRAQGFFLGRPMRGDLVSDWTANYRLPRASKTWVAPTGT